MRATSGVVRNEAETIRSVGLQIIQVDVRSSDRSVIVAPGRAALIGDQLWRAILQGRFRRTSTACLRRRQPQPDDSMAATIAKYLWRKRRLGSLRCNSGAEQRRCGPFTLVAVHQSCNTYHIRDSRPQAANPRLLRRHSYWIMACNRRALPRSVIGFGVRDEIACCVMAGPAPILPAHCQPIASCRHFAQLLWCIERRRR